MNTTTNTATPDPRHVFLTPREVFSRYRWGRTKGYEMLRSEGFARPIAGAYRLDLLMAWEERQVLDRAAGSQSVSAARSMKRDRPATATTAAGLPTGSSSTPTGAGTDAFGLPTRAVSRRARKAVQ